MRTNRKIGNFTVGVRDSTDWTFITLRLISNYNSYYLLMPLIESHRLKHVFGISLQSSAGHSIGVLKYTRKKNGEHIMMCSLCAVLTSSASLTTTTKFIQFQILIILIKTLITFSVWRHYTTGLGPSIHWDSNPKVFVRSTSILAILQNEKWQFSTHSTRTIYLK